MRQYYYEYYNIISVFNTIKKAVDVWNNNILRVCIWPHCNACTTDWKTHQYLQLYLSFIYSHFFFFLIRFFRRWYLIVDTHSCCRRHRRALVFTRSLECNCRRFHIKYFPLRGVVIRKFSWCERERPDGSTIATTRIVRLNKMQQVTVRPSLRPL